MEDNMYLFISDIQESGDEKFELKQRKYVYWQAVVSSVLLVFCCRMDREISGERKTRSCCSIRWETTKI